MRSAGSSALDKPEVAFIEVVLLLVVSCAMEGDCAAGMSSAAALLNRRRLLITRPVPSFLKERNRSAKGIKLDDDDDDCACDDGGEDG